MISFKDTLELLDGQIKKNNVLIEYKNNNVIIKCDRMRILEVLQNLIDNAIKFMGTKPKHRGARRAHLDRVISWQRHNFLFHITVKRPAGFSDLGIFSRTTCRMEHSIS